MRDIKHKGILSKTVLPYTGFFVIFAFLAFMWHILSGRTLMWFNDGYDQHYKALLFYGDFLRNTIKFIFTGQFQNITSWSYLIGEGGDVLQVLNYYAAGDPLCLLTILFNASNMYICYCLIAVLRLYFAGLAFIYLAEYKGIGTNVSRIAGSLTYIFSMWGIYQASRHIMFLIPLIYLPLIITGIEKLLDNKKSLLLTISVFLAAISNFYYFYNVVLLIVFYCAVRFILKYGKDISSYLKAFGKLFINALTGVLMAGIIFIPISYAFLTDTRIDSRSPVNLIYPLSYYLELPSGFLTTTSISLGISAPAVIALVILFTHKPDKNSKVTITLRVLSILCFVFFMFPVIGQIFNGMNYSSNKWSFAVPLLLGISITYMWDQLVLPLKKRDLLTLGIVFLILLLAILYEGNRRGEYFVAVIALMAFAAISVYVFPRKSYKINSAITIGFIALSICINSFYLNSAGGANYAAEARRPGELLERDNNNEFIAIKELNDNSFYRISGQDIYRNGALVTNIPSVMYFWTISNPNEIHFNANMELLDYKLYEVENYDDRSSLNEISSVKYYSVPENYTCIPYGYEPISNQTYEGYTIYENKYPVGLTFSTDTIIDSSYSASLPAIYQQEMFLKGAIVDDSNLETTNPENLLTTTLNYTEELSEDVTHDFSSKKYIATGSSSVVKLNIDGIPNSETYITFEGVHYNAGDEAYIVIATDKGVTKVLSFYEEDYQYYNGRRDFTVNLGFNEDTVNEVYFAFVLEGEYSYENISVFCQPMDNYVDDVTKINEEVLESVNIYGSHIDGKVNFSNNRMLVYTLPYSDGWTATVDGTSVPIYKVDTKYMGLYIDAGEHEVKLSYHTPFLNIGLISTFIGVVGLVLLARKKESRD